MDHVIDSLVEILSKKEFPRNQLENIIQEISKNKNKDERLTKVQIGLEEALLDQENWKYLTEKALRHVALVCCCVGEKGVEGPPGEI